MVERQRENWKQIQILGTYSDRDSCNEETIEIPKVMSRLVDIVYDLRKDRTEKEDEVKRKIKEVGYSLSKPIECPFPVFYAVFRKQETCQYTRAPEVVIAIRGTFDRVDYKSDVRVVLQLLDGDKRYHHLEKVADLVVKEFGHEKVAIAGHSLGASFALLMAKVLVGKKMPVETYLFNPPCPSFDFVCSQNLRVLGKSFKGMLLMTYRILSIVSPGIRHRLILVRKSYAVTKMWAPHIFLNKGDYINLGYINQIKDMKVTGLQKLLYELVQPHTLMSLITTKGGHSHLVSSADVTFGGSFPTLLSHSLKQWHKDDEWESGNKVELLKFGRQLCQRTYGLRRKDFQLGDSDMKAMVYRQTKTSTGVQAVVSMATVGLATSKQKQVIFLFNTEQDADTAKQLWPETTTYPGISEFIAQDQSFEFRFQKLKKGVFTFYIYAVKSKHVSFQREIEWRALLKMFQLMEDYTDWLKVIRVAVFMTAAFPIMI